MVSYHIFATLLEKNLLVDKSYYIIKFIINITYFITKKIINVYNYFIKQLTIL